MDQVLSQILIHGGPVGAVAVAFAVVHICTLKYLVRQEEKRTEQLVRSFGRHMTRLVRRLDRVETKVDGLANRERGHHDG